MWSLRSRRCRGPATPTAAALSAVKLDTSGRLPQAGSGRREPRLVALGGLVWLIPVLWSRHPAPAASERRSGRPVQAQLGVCR